jgi:hypothetical protein
MDVYEIERYIRNNAIEASTLTEVLLDKLKEVTRSYEQLTEVLDDRGFSDDPSDLDVELANIAVDYENLSDEYKTLQDELNQIKASV